MRREIEGAADSVESAEARRTRYRLDATFESSFNFQPTFDFEKRLRVFSPRTNERLKSYRSVLISDAAPLRNVCVGHAALILNDGFMELERKYAKLAHCRA